MYIPGTSLGLARPSHRAIMKQLGESGHGRNHHPGPSVIDTRYPLSPHIGRYDESHGRLGSGVGDCVDVGGRVLVGAHVATGGSDTGGPVITGGSVNGGAVMYGGRVTGASVCCVGPGVPTHDRTSRHRSLPVTVPSLDTLTWQPRSN